MVTLNQLPPYFIPMQSWLFLLFNGLNLFALQFAPATPNGLEPAPTRLTINRTEARHDNSPIVIHILWFTPSENLADDAQIQSQIDVLNEDFRH